MNALEQYRLDHGLTYEELARAAGVDRGNAWRHCQGQKPITGESALRYHAKLGIPLRALRPDLFPESSDSRQKARRCSDRGGSDRRGGEGAFPAMVAASATPADTPPAPSADAGRDGPGRD